MSEIVTIAPGSKEWHKLRKRCREDLYFLNAKILGHENIGGVGGWCMTPRAHYGLCRFAERRTGIPEIDNSRVQLIQVGRGWGKSLIVTKARTIQRLLQDRDWAAGIMNEGSRMAEGFLAGIKAEFETNDLLRHLFPEIIPKDTNTTVWRSDRIVVNRSRPNPLNPSVLATGAEGTVTGVHMNEWIVDDLLSEDAAENARTGSFTEIGKLNRRIIQLQPLLSRPKRDPITFIGTPWWPGDCYDFVEELFGRGEEPTTYIWNLSLPDGSTQHITLLQKGELAIFRFKPIQENRCVFPEVFDEDTLAQLREDDPVFFAAQYLLEPTAGGVAAFKEEYLKEFEYENLDQIRYRDGNNELRYERLRDMTKVMSVDLARSRKATAARSAIVVTASNGENIFLVEAWAKRAAPSDLAAQILALYKTHRPQRIIIESVGYQIALADILALMAREMKLQRLPIYEFVTGSDQKKIQRIAGLEPYFRKGFFYYHPRSQTDFFEEYIRFSPDIGNRTVDILDAITFQRESWEQLGMLGSKESAKEMRARRRMDEYAKISRIRDKYSRRRRTVQWEQPF